MKSRRRRNSLLPLRHHSPDEPLPERVKLLGERLRRALRARRHLQQPTSLPGVPHAHVSERGANVRLIRDNVVIHEGKLSTLKRFKDEVKDVQAGQECGMAFENYEDMRAGDVIECYRVEEIKRTL